MGPGFGSHYIEILRHHPLTHLKKILPSFLSYLLSKLSVNYFKLIKILLSEILVALTSVHAQLLARDKIGIKKEEVQNYQRMKR